MDKVSNQPVCQVTISAKTERANDIFWRYSLNLSMNESFMWVDQIKSMNNSNNDDCYNNSDDVDADNDDDVNNNKN